MALWSSIPTDTRATGTGATLSATTARTSSTSTMWGFWGALADNFIAEIDIDPGGVFATGISRGGSMALRLALKAPSRFRAVAAASESPPVPENFKCKPAGGGTSSVMIMNGTMDPLVPFDGGEVNLFGLFIRRGKVLASRDSGQYFADLNHIAGAPATNQTQAADGVRVEHVHWRNDSKVEVELVAIHGGGHGIPQPHGRHPRLLGPSPRETQRTGGDLGLLRAAAAEVESIKQRKGEH